MMTAQFRKTIDTTYADLRPSDLVIDKSGQAWPLDPTDIAGDAERVGFWLCDPVSKVRMHYLTKPRTDAVKVSRLPTQADEASKLKAEFDVIVVTDGASVPDRLVRIDEAVAAVKEIGGTVEAEFPECEHQWTDSDPELFTKGAVRCLKCGEVQPRSTAVIPEGVTLPTVAEQVTAAGIKPTGNYATIEEALDAHAATMAEAVAAVKEIGGTIEAEVTAAEVDAAAAATDDAPLTIIPFADMTPLEARSHLYLLHGVYGHDLQGKAELAALHDQAHAATTAGTLNSRHVPHTHEVKV